MFRKHIFLTKIEYLRVPRTNMSAEIDKKKYLGLIMFVKMIIYPLQKLSLVKHTRNQLGIGWKTISKRFIIIVLQRTDEMILMPKIFFDPIYN